MRALSELFDEARAKLARGALTLEDIDRLREAAAAARKRQRLLVLHAQQPTVRARVVAAALHEPVAGSVTEIDPLAPAIPYATVLDAVIDGWRIIGHPEPRSQDFGLVGYPFILEKMEAYAP